MSNRSKAPENRQLGVIVALFWFSQYVYIPYQTPYLTALEVSAGFIGVIIGAYGITQMLLRIPAGLMADRSGSHKRFILLGQGAAVTANLTRIFFPGGIGFLAANLLSGLASALWISYMMMVIQGYPPQEKQRGTSRAILYNNIGILSGFVWGMVFYERWGMTFLCVSAVAAAGLGLMLALGLKDHPREGRVPPVRELLTCGCGRRVMTFALLALVQQGIQMSTTMSFTTQVMKSLGAGAGFIGASSVFYMACAVVASRLGATQTFLRWGGKRLVPVMFLLSLAYCLLVPRVTWLPGLFALQLLPGVTNAVLMAYLTGEAMARVPKQAASTALGFFQAVYAVGMTVFPMATGFVAGRVSVEAAYNLLAGTALLAGLATLLIYRGILGRRKPIQS